MTKKILWAILALVLLAAPLAVRWAAFYEGRYQPSKVARPDLDRVAVPEFETTTFADLFVRAAPGTILIDRTHANRIEMGELNVLQARLSARGQLIEPVEAVKDLAGQLRYANALVVISPGQDWAPAEVSLVEAFVAKGGRLLLVTDPTRYGIAYDKWDMPVIDSDVEHMNSLSSRFGVLFQSDYLYNTHDNAGNFRNVRLSEFGSHPLTEGLEEVVFFAAHSIISEERTLIRTSGETRSSTRGRQDVPVAVLAANEQVLALGDLTFLFEPYNAVRNNDTLIAHIASFLAGAERDYNLADFPFFFGDRVDLVYAGAPILDSSLLDASTDLQTLFSDSGKELSVRDGEKEDSDTLFVGLYKEAQDLESYLAKAGVTLPPSLETSSSALSATATPPASADTTTDTAEDHIRIGAVGTMVVTSTALLLWQEEGGRQVMILLSDTPSGLENAIERLSNGDLGDCLSRESGTGGDSLLLLCPAGEVGSSSNGSGLEKPQPEAETPDHPNDNDFTPDEEPAPDEEKNTAHILVVSLDDGKPRYMGRTEAEDYVAILEDSYRMEVWSTREKGLPPAEDLLEYDLTIWTGGDYLAAMGEEESDLAFEVMLAGNPVMTSGAFVYDSETVTLQRDVQVKNAEHPLAQGFAEDEVIPFLSILEGGIFETAVLDDVFEDETTEIPFIRGPESEDAGVTSVFVMEDSLVGIRFVLIGFPIYLLPEPERELLVQNSVTWLLEP